MNGTGQFCTDAKLSKTEQGCEFERPVGMNIFEEYEFSPDERILFEYFILYFVYKLPGSMNRGLYYSVKYPWSSAAHIISLKAFDIFFLTRNLFNVSFKEVTNPSGAAEP